MDKRCCICDAPTSRGFYCNKCYHMWKEEIFAKKEWVRYLVNLEVNRRRRYEPIMIYIGNMDINDNGELVKNA